MKRVSYKINNCLRREVEVKRVNAKNTTIK